MDTRNNEKECRFCGSIILNSEAIRCSYCGAETQLEYRQFYREVLDMRDGFIRVKVGTAKPDSLIAGLRSGLAWFVWDVFVTEPISASGLSKQFDAEKASEIVEIGLAYVERCYSTLIGIMEELHYERMEHWGESDPPDPPMPF
ncbi:MAG: hypothetical protein FWG88_05200 [Oscillospiraceae bacterium]|nr:hypothetical protein [Oscillospiraceae bacterium]